MSPAMTHTLTRLLLAAFLTTSLGGCLFVSKKPAHSSRSQASKSKSCKPSQHWEDGHCVHNGKGKGARKHDGR